ncbi:phytanoyl-CoA dioxygenase family protein [Blastopirellula marina]|uniref:Phytanoyl-CoA dioxygenase family protein n=1 Tax=Blastopirellula marina TaxID=124 RepID=A0A2S8GIY7_9BACT|nr:phytanoyl-CoA dioxygenase family protein [Blastopirellula marina]PQO44386.1 phytanoyl-CoA dioxygenase family protein [Blastopirellula marina]
MAADISLQHAPVSPEFFNKFVNDDFRLTDEQVAFFHENGYLSGVKILEDEQVEMLREELEKFFDSNHDGRDLWYEYHTNESATPDTVLFHALGAWRVGPGFHDILWAPAFVKAAEQLLDGQVRFWHDQLFCKPSNHGGVVAWHQDYSYWTRTKPMAHLTCWIGLDDADRDNGCVQYVPGSHKWDLLPITGLAGDMDAIQEVLTPEQWEQFQHPVPAELKKGEATFHHPLTVHGSFANCTDRPRRATVINAFRDGVCSDSDDVLLVGVPPIAKGAKMEGQFFPLLSKT